MLTLQDLKKSRKLSLQSFRTSESMSSSNVKVMKSRRRKITKAFRITTNMSMSDHSSANGKMKKRSHIIQVLEIKIKTPKDYELKTLAVYARIQIISAAGFEGKELKSTIKMCISRVTSPRGRLLPFCYHYGLLIHHFLKIQRVLMVMDLNLQVIMERSTNMVNVVGGKTSIELPFDLNMPALEDYSIFNFLRDDEDDGAMADINNLDTTIQVFPNPTTRIHKDHPLNQVIGDFQSATQTRKMSKNFEEHVFIETMQEELLQFKLQEFWTLVDLPNGKRAIGFKWGFKNKKDKRGIVIRNIERLVAQGYTQEEGIDYDEDLKIQTFLIEYTRLKKHCTDYIKILELVYVDDIIFGSTKMELCIAFEKLMHEKFQMSSRGELTFFLGLQVQQKRHDIFISQYKYVAGILKKFGFTEVKTASTPMETQKPLLKDEDCEEVDVHMYRSMIVSLITRIAKTINREAQLHALVDGKTIIITESSVRRDLQLADEEAWISKVSKASVYASRRTGLVYLVDFTRCSVNESVLGENGRKEGRIGVIDEILEEDFDALLDEVVNISISSKNQSRRKTFAEFTEFMALTVDRKF
ncbi:uncharacterized mitochondrial protein-like protein [Tanacetum coccineum]